MDMRSRRCRGCSQSWGNGVWCGLETFLRLASLGEILGCAQHDMGPWDYFAGLTMRIMNHSTSPGKSW